MRWISVLGLGPVPPLGNWPAREGESLPISRSPRSRQHLVLQRRDALEPETLKREAMILVELPRTCIFPAELL